MGQTNVPPVEVIVDEAVPVPLGWAVTEVRARLVTDPTPSDEVVPGGSVTGASLFDSGRRVDRFSRFGDAPHVVVTLECR